MAAHQQTIAHDSRTTPARVSQALYPPIAAILRDATLGGNGVIHLPDWVNRILGINYRTTILGIGVIVAAVGRFVMAFKSKQYDFTALAEDGQLIMTTLGLLLAGLAATKAKDQNVTGTGTTAKSVDSTGTITNREGEVVGRQPPKE